MADFDRRAAVTELQLASIPDIQGSIHADDTKASVGLVVHGLLFTGAASVVSSLGRLYADANDTARCLGWLSLGLASATFVVSILALIQAARPRNPKRALRTAGAFFPRGKGSRDERTGAQQKSLDGLRGPYAFEQEYAREQIKLMDIHMSQARWAKIGFWSLTAEVTFVALFLILVAAVASGHWRANASDLRVRWTVRDGGPVQRVTGTKAVEVRRTGAVTVVVRLKGRGAKRLEITGSRTCPPGKGPVHPPARPISATRDEGDKPTVSATLTTACPRGARRGVHATLFAVGRSDDDLVTRRLKIAPGAP